MDTHITVEMSGQEYYNATDIYNFDPLYFAGCNGNVRNIVIRKKISNDEHMYAYLKDNEWKVSKKGGGLLIFLTYSDDFRIIQ